MSLKMDCAGAEELFSDHIEATLHPLLRTELEDHLGACGACAALRAAVAEVMDTMRAAAELPAPPGLADRVAEAALLAGRTPEAPVAMPFWLQGVAAALALAVTGFVLALGPSDTAARVGRLRQWTVHTAVYVAERKDRLVEDLRLIRVVVGTAFEGRLDRVNDRVDDYKRLLEKRRNTTPETPETDKKTNDFPRNFFVPNSDVARLVPVSERQGRRSSEKTRRSLI